MMLMIYQNKSLCFTKILLLLTSFWNSFLKHWMIESLRSNISVIYSEEFFSFFRYQRFSLQNHEANDFDINLSTIWIRCLQSVNKHNMLSYKLFKQATAKKKQNSNFESDHKFHMRASKNWIFIQLNENCSSCWNTLKLR